MAAKRKSPAPKGSRSTPRQTAPPRQLRDVLIRNGVALLVAALTVSAVARLFYFGAWVQLGLIAAACAGLLATSPAWAAAIAAAAVAAGLSVVLGSFGAEIAKPAALALVVAPAIRWATGRKPSASDWIAYAVIGLIVVNMWATTFYVNSPNPLGVTPVAEQIARSPKAGASWTDQEFYQRVLWLMRHGTGYYESYRKAFNENTKWRMDPPSVISYRLPTAFWFWASLPGGARAMFVAWLVVSTAALAAGVRLALHRVRPVFAIPAVAALATYLIYFGTRGSIFFVEAWAATLAIIAVAATVESFRSKAWRGWTLAAVAFAVLACLVRELMVYLPVAAVIAAIAAGGPQRRFRVLAWGAGLGVFAAAYLAHVVAIDGAVSGVGASLALSSGGLGFFADAFSWATAIIGGGAVVLVVYGIMAAAGIWFSPDPSERWFLAVAAALPLAAFLVFGNDARFENGTRTNYWGTVIVPVLIVLSPWAFATIPGLAPAKGDAARAGRSS
jgi:hypothetical protein